MLTKACDVAQQMWDHLKDQGFEYHHRDVFLHEYASRRGCTTPPATPEY